MAIMHCQIKNIGRSSGRSAVASSAYRSGEKLEDMETGLQHDYTKKSGIEYTEIILCKNAPEEYKDRSTLWNEVQKIEKSSDARLAREWEVAIPKELSLEQGQKLVHDYGQSLANEGMCIDLAIHDKGDGNRHAHIMGTTRAIKEDGTWAPKSKKVYDLDENGERIFQKLDKQNRKIYKNHKEDFTDWNNTEKVEEWRERWAHKCNKYLSLEQMIDHRSFERQGKEDLPTIHEGFVAREIEKNGGVSELCQTNRDIKEYNNLNQELSRLGAIRQLLVQQLENIKERAKEALNERLQRLRTARTTNEPAGRNADGNRTEEPDHSRPTDRSIEERLASLRSTRQSGADEPTVGELLRNARANLNSANAIEKDSGAERDNKISQRQDRETSRERQRAEAQRRAEQAEQLAKARKTQYRETHKYSGPER
ncbi:MAG TPA: MobQ family relaxase [Chitinispirillaceae bacterium]|nr:MobQ family relaxase [Chitinispirillaceae bacterium]